MHIIHLTASTFFGGPERQMLGLARALPAAYRSTFLSFSEQGRCQPFLRQVRWNGFAGHALKRDTPNLPGAIWELAGRLQAHDADILLCHGYKANLVGRLAAKAVGIPAVAVARGWTGEDRKVRLYEMLDRLHLRYMERVVCVSAGQARAVVRAGMPPARTVVIRNAARLVPPGASDPAARMTLQKLFRSGGKIIAIAAGRLSPEKGFDVLIEAARLVVSADDDVRFAILGEGMQRPMLQRLIDVAKLNGTVVLPGFRSDLDQLLPSADLFVLSSFAEGLPNVVLEAGAAGLPVVATAVGGTPEVVVDGRTGYLIAQGNPAALAARIVKLSSDDTLRQAMGQAGREHVQRHFTFEAQAQAYLRLFASMGLGRKARIAA